MTRTKIDGKGEGIVFTDVDEARRAYENNAVELQTKAKVRVSVQILDDQGNKQLTTKICRYHCR